MRNRLITARRRNLLIEHRETEYTVEIDWVRVMDIPLAKDSHRTGPRININMEIITFSIVFFFNHRMSRPTGGRNFQPRYVRAGRPPRSRGRRVPLLVGERISDSPAILPGIPCLSDDQIEECSRVLMYRDSLNGVGNCGLTCRDFSVLGPCGWLNDSVINQFLRLLSARGERCFAHSTFFWTKLNQSGYNFEGVKKWGTKVGMNICDHDLVLVPIHLGNHWTLGVIDITNCVTQYLDPLGKELSIFHEQMHRYMNDAAIECSLPVRRWSSVSPTCLPLQETTYDCGVFICIYAFYISRREPIPRRFGQGGVDRMRMRILMDIIGGRLSY